MKEGDKWVALPTEPFNVSPDSVVVRYVVQSECATIESGEMVLRIEKPTPDNSPELDNFSLKHKYKRILLFDLNSFKEKYNWEPRPDQVTWYKVVGELDAYGNIVDDDYQGTGYSYNSLNGERLEEGAYYAVVEQDTIEGNECERAYRSTVVVATLDENNGPKLVPMWFNLMKC